MCKFFVMKHSEKKYDSIIQFTNGSYDLLKLLKMM